MTAQSVVILEFLFESAAAISPCTAKTYASNAVLAGADAAVVSCGWQLFLLVLLSRYSRKRDVRRMVGQGCSVCVPSSGGSGNSTSDDWLLWLPDDKPLMDSLHQATASKV